ncbi:hypothetical protein AH02_20 [Pseudomonas phage AH02]|nr:hypothetical protein AH02_20 [Pseudomonas phage AH02]
MSEMVEAPVSELEGPALDWAVANVELITVGIAEPQYENGYRVYQTFCRVDYKYSPSTDWSLCGPLIEKHIDGFGSLAGRTEWEAYCWGSEVTRATLYFEQGPNPLIAACRAIVAAKLGDTVMVPKELC